MIDLRTQSNGVIFIATIKVKDAKSLSIGYIEDNDTLRYFITIKNKTIFMYAQLFYISEEGNHYPQTERLYIDDSLKGCLKVPKEHEGNNAYWQYYNQSDYEFALTGGWHITDNNIHI